MEVLLAALLMLWGNVFGGQESITFEQLVQASLEAKNAAVMQPIKQDPQPGAPLVKGVYSTANSAGGAKLQTLLKLLDDTELNSLVIDVKDDFGNITFHSTNSSLQELGTFKPIIPDMSKLMETLKQHEVYPIARIVVFKDTLLAKKKPELSFQNPNGTLWNNGKAYNPDSFVNPYKKEVWDYNIEVAKEAALQGFKEIQFDYVRFPEGFENKADKLKYFKTDELRTQIIADFVKYAREQLNPLGVRVSVDIFGYAASVPAAEGIGQDFAAISKNVDIICPMIYPSHYSTGWYGSKVPDAQPYTTISGAIVDTKKKIEPLQDLKPLIRPWIQDFTATWVPGHIPYRKKQIEDQIQALKDNGIHEFLLWNAANTYTSGVNYDN